MPMPRRPHRASPDEIKITRDGDTAIIAYADPKVATTHFKIGREKLTAMSDEEVFALWNEHIEARDQLMQEYDHVAVEVPPGHPQVRYFEEGDQWVPRGDVLRCVVMGSNGEPDEPFITIDDRDFTPKEFAKMVGTFGGWGMRIVFVPDDELHDEPVVEVREPDREP
ncbi:MAG: hypothetical protein ABSF69_20140 [Polyangiaceae bacterium]|jgi:hypothetical protein